MTIRGSAEIAVLVLLSCLTAAGAEIDMPLDVPVVRQQKNGCGAAAVAMVMWYWSDYFDLPGEMRPDPSQIYEQLYRPETHVIRLSDMRDYVAQRGFHAFTLQGTMKDLEEQTGRGRPLIVGLRKGPRAILHFEVVTGIDGKHVWLNDSSRRKPTRMSRSRFENSWSAAEHWLLLAVPESTDEEGTEPNIGAGRYSGPAPPVVKYLPKWFLISTSTLGFWGAS